MMEGPDPLDALASSYYSALEEEKKRNIDEIERLRAILEKNNISSARELSKNTIVQRTRRSTRLSRETDKALPHLPTEILLRILSFSVRSSTPIIDPFYKPSKVNLTRDERCQRKNFSISMLSTCKPLSIEGVKLLFSNNEFIFTQAAAIAKFATFPLELRETVKHITLRVVGCYYDDRAAKRDLTDNTGYHVDIDMLTMPVYARPPGMVKDRGIQAYCWEQLTDFLKALVISVPPTSKVRPKMFPNLKSMRIDLVNFVDHLPYGGFQFGSVIRWHLGQFLDELIITGAPAGDLGFTSEEKLLHNLVNDGGLIGSAKPLFVSLNKGSGIRSLRPLDLSLQVLRADANALLTLNSSPSKKENNKAEIHPEGGAPPKSYFPSGRTVWKWTYETLTSEKKSWIEFDKASGFPADDVSWSDIDYEDESMGFGSDENMDEDEIDDEMPGLMMMD